MTTIDIATLSAEDRKSLTSLLKTPRITASERVSHPSCGAITAGMTVRIKEDAASVSKKYRGMTFTVTGVGTKGRLYGNNPDNVDPVTGAQVDKNKRLWPRADECEIVAVVSAE